MHKDRILALADLIEQQPHTSPEAESGFTMRVFTHDCGTPACIAGWSVWEAMGRPDGDILVGKIDRAAEEYLGISDATLFYPDVLETYAQVTPAHAAFTLRHLAETGVVDWLAYPGKDGTNDQQ